MVPRLFLAAFPCLLALIPIASCATGADTVFPPFTAGEPVLGGTGCSGVQIHGAGQMTFCGN